MGGWVIGYSLPLEIDTALYYAASQAQHILTLSPSVLDFIQTVPKDWQQEFHALFGDVPRSFAPLNIMGSWAGSLYESDYRRATMPMRELRLADAIAIRAEQLASHGETPDPIAEPLAYLVALEQRISRLNYQTIGLTNANESILGRRLEIEVKRTAALLRDGATHTAFWFLVDRFYYEIYLPWRTTRLAYMENMAQQAALILGGTPAQDFRAHQESPKFLESLHNLQPLSPLTADLPSGVLYFHSNPPTLSWLPAQNLLRSYQSIAERIATNEALVYFWVEPYEMFDNSFGERGVFGVTFAQPGAMYENFRGYLKNMSSRAQAFADPTRLLIMRMMRHFSLDNTTMSNYMGISRPTVSEHARILREAGFIVTHQEGRQVRHEVQPEAVAQFLRDLKEFLDLDIEV